MKSEVETVVIGSGFGGAIAAKRLTDAGREVVMLERGPWRDTVPNRSAGLTALSPLPQGWKTLTHSLRSVRAKQFRQALLLNPDGFIELYHGEGINIVCSSSVGGGSHIYAAMLAKPAWPDYWNNRDSTITADLMERYYQEIIALLQARAVTEADKVPNNIAQTNYNGMLSTAGLGSPLIGIRLPERPGKVNKITDRHGIARWECNYQNNSILGSPSGAKTTLDFAVLIPALKRGLDIQDRCEVTSLSKLTDAASNMRYEIHYRDFRDKSHRTIRAKQVVLAAGCLNTVRLLLTSRDRKGGLTGMPRLGHQFGTNGGFFGLWQENSSFDLSQGLPLCGPFRARDSASEHVQVLRAAIQGVEKLPLPGFLRRWTKKNAFIVALGKDNNNGLMQLDRGKLRITYDKKKSPVYHEIDNEVRAIKQLTGTKIFAPKSPVTVQPLGGACLGTSNANGVINACGEIFDNPGLYVVDAAALPESPGRPPSLTIAAWAALVADRLIASLEAASAKP